MIPASVAPVLEVTRTHLVENWGAPADLPREFWRATKEPLREEGFYFLSGELMWSDIDTSSLPAGYAMVQWLFLWESLCSNEGWLSFDNLDGGELERVLTCYRLAGLAAEASALEQAYHQWLLTPGDQEAIGAVYQSVPNEFREDFDRIPFLVRTLTENADTLFEESPAGPEI